MEPLPKTNRPAPIVIAIPCVPAMQLAVLAAAAITCAPAMAITYVTATPMSLHVAVIQIYAVAIKSAPVTRSVSATGFDEAVATDNTLTERGK